MNLFPLLNYVSSSDLLLEFSKDDKRFVRERVIGGKSANANDYPWFVDFGSCGGSLIAPEFVLTAAHCYKYGSWEVATVGKFCRRRDNCGHAKKRFRIMDTIMHPDYDSYNGSHDLMLVKMKGRSSVEPVEMDDGTLSPSYEPGRDNLWTAGMEH